MAAAKKSAGQRWKERQGKAAVRREREILERGHLFFFEDGDDPLSRALASAPLRFADQERAVVAVSEGVFEAMLDERVEGPYTRVILRHAELGERVVRCLVVRHLALGEAAGCFLCPGDAAKFWESIAKDHASAIAAHQSDAQQPPLTDDEEARVWRETPETTMYIPVPTQEDLDEPA